MSEKKVNVLAPALGALVIGAASLHAAEPGVDELRQQIDALRQRVRQLEGTAGPTSAPAAQGTSAQATPGQVTSAQVAQDARRRSEAFNLATGGGFTAGYDKGFFIKSDDGNFLLKPAVQFQFRYDFNDRQDAAHGGSDDLVQDGFEVRRARFRFDGNVLTPKLTYSFVWDTSRANGTVSLLDAWAQYAFTPNLALKAGQFKESWAHERDVSGYQQLAVDRSIVDAILGGNITDRVQGVSLILGGGKDRPYRVEVAYHDGANSRNTNFQDSTGATGTRYGGGARGEWKFFGDWASYKDFTAKASKENLLVLGAGADYTERLGTDVLLTTVDAQYELADRLGVYGAAHANFTDPHDSTSNISRTDYGALVQAGYLVNKKVEVFGRYDVVRLDADAVAAGAEDTFHEITAGVNYYLGPDGSYLHRAKLTFDVGYLPNGAPSDQTQSGVLGGDDDQFVLRAQFQLLI